MFRLQVENNLYLRSIDKRLENISSFGPTKLDSEDKELLSNLPIGNIETLKKFDEMLSNEKYQKCFVIIN